MRWLYLNTYMVKENRIHGLSEFGKSYGSVPKVRAISYQYKVKSLIFAWENNNVAKIVNQPFV